MLGAFPCSGTHPGRHQRLFEGDRLISDGRREEIARTVSLALRERLGFSEAGPDATNPNTYFAQTPLKHTTFLRRILKTFAADADGKVPDNDDDDQPLTRSTRDRAARRSEPAAVSGGMSGVGQPAVTGPVVASDEAPALLTESDMTVTARQGSSRI